MGLGEFPRGWGAGILLVTRLVMVSRPAGNGKSAGNSRLYVTVGRRVNDDFPTVSGYPVVGITIDTGISRAYPGACYMNQIHGLLFNNSQ